jgi:anti-sigma regulatory factor (Ser/Thr protein kinase)
MGLLVLPHELASAAVARRHVADMLQRQGVSPERCDDATLVVSELVGNALRHGRPRADGTLQVQWTLDGHRLRVEVTDGGGSTEPQLSPLAERQMAMSGRGLAIIDVIAEAWGSHSDDAGTTVWALVPAPPLRLHGLPDYGELENTG